MSPTVFALRAPRPDRPVRRTLVSGLLSMALALGGATLVLGCSGGTAMTGDAGPAGRAGAATAMPQMTGAFPPAAGDAGAATAMPEMTGPAPLAPAGDDTAMAMPHGMTDVQLDAAWSARPAFVKDNGTQVAEAYAFALTHPAPLESMPCYCGCVAMDHRSNLDCFFKPQAKPGTPLTFEEHASFCGVCVDTALLTKHRLAEGATLSQIRHEVDTTIGSNGVEGTHTPLPPEA